MSNYASEPKTETITVGTMSFDYQHPYEKDGAIYCPLNIRHVALFLLTATTPEEKKAAGEIYSKVMDLEMGYLMAAQQRSIDETVKKMMGG